MVDVGDDGKVSDLLHAGPREASRFLENQREIIAHAQAAWHLTQGTDGTTVEMPAKTGLDQVPNTRTQIMKYFLAIMLLTFSFTASATTVEKPTLQSIQADITEKTERHCTPLQNVALRTKDNHANVGNKSQDGDCPDVCCVDIKGTRYCGQCTCA
ncbi:hypothetical protein [Lysobacter panacisoli]|uniref:hypothetical protein n=1 Tax=Lysobacter panacisoli TaxID=1255263 RepID=UPI00131DCC1A|nr:hypothetical protein [Lysobacter panacisoli]